MQSETYTTANPDNPNQIVVAYNDSRGSNASPINISGASVSTDGGTTFTRLTTGSGQSPFANTLGDPVILYNKPTGTWFTMWLDRGSGLDLPSVYASGWAVIAGTAILTIVAWIAGLASWG